NGGLYLTSRSLALNRCFDAASFCEIGHYMNFFEDTIGKGKASLTGAEYFTPAQVEVYAVAHA
ncbi:MAG: hypothetical protein P4L87_06550, partial [Formivibrio sp.]|nr:hypothetical protein [Formivibrio sp.]